SARRAAVALAGAGLSALLLVACGARSVAGTYNVVNAPFKGAVVTFGKDSFSFSTGASGRYEVSDGKVILTGDMVSGTYRIDGDKLVGDQFIFVPRDPGDKSPINLGPRGMSNEQGSPN
uniref:hypothetical protein n=1 Tax=Sphingomonas bacterium TaxID=1895847 RepID=UPI001C2D24EA